MEVKTRYKVKDGYGFKNKTTNEVIFLNTTNYNLYNMWY